MQLCLPKSMIDHLRLGYITPNAVYLASFHDTWTVSTCGTFTKGCQTTRRGVGGEGGGMLRYDNPCHHSCCPGSASTCIPWVFWQSHLGRCMACALIDHASPAPGRFKVAIELSISCALSMPKRCNDDCWTWSSSTCHRLCRPHS